MLDTSTKKRIDDCRDILVGKLPDPKAQIEQITIGLIYKFMDDMDKEVIELGGSAKFFSGEYEKYSWDNLFNSKVTASDMLKLYSEAIESMEFNPNIPQLFRDIFNNAYLPYRDPETLKLFLKTISEFQYTHSEKLGDAFEYLLSVMGSQGDAGQFRTPRHIIDFIVAVVDPQKTDTILDPACGTAGFLISAFKHIREQNKGKLTPDERKKMIRNFVGYDISPDMVRLSLVNMYLHGFSDPHIHEYDTLSSEERWNERFDVILANPPFMSPKGGIRPHKKFSIQSNRSEVLFVDYIAEHLNPKGRAGVIVPEGVIFQSGKAYKELRKMLVENYLYAVISLPAGVFNPYSGVKTSILLMDKEVAKQSNEFLFVKIENDGYSLGAQRTPVKGSQIVRSINLIKEFKEKGSITDETTNAHIVSKAKICNQSDFNLSGSRYIDKVTLNTNFEKVKLVDVLDYEQPTKYIVNNTEYSDTYKTPVLTAGKSFILGYTNEQEGIYKASLPVIIFDDFTTATKFVDFPFKVKSSAMKILKAKRDKANIAFLYYMMQQIQFDSTNHKRYWISQYSKIQIPLPPLSIQEEIVTETEGYQKIIDGAKAVVENYKPKIDIDPDWEMVELSVIAKIEMGQSPPGDSYNLEGDGIPLINGPVEFGPDPFSKTIVRQFTTQPTKLCEKGDLILCVRGSTTGRMNIAGFNGCIGRGVASIRSEKYQDWINYYINSVREYIYRLGSGSTFPNVTSSSLKSLQIPLPPNKTQNSIISNLDKEREIVDLNKTLIEIFQKKIENKIKTIWGVGVS